MFRYHYEVRNASAAIVKTFGADYHAARAYAREFLPGFDVIPGGIRYDLIRSRFEAVNHETQTGAVLYAVEL